MAIVINGSGTVTGISVGGLPDAIVDDGTLATDSVTAAKLKDDAIAVGDLPAGSVLQVVQNALNPSAYTTTSSSWTVITDMDVTITPTATSSKVLVTFNCGGAIVAAATNQNAIHVRIKRGSTVIRSLVRYGYNRNDDYSSIPVFITYLDSPSTTSATTYTIEMMTDAGSMHINRDAITNGGVTIAQEIAG